MRTPACTVRLGFHRAHNNRSMRGKGNFNRLESITTEKPRNDKCKCDNCRVRVSFISDQKVKHYRCGPSRTCLSSGGLKAASRHIGDLMNAKSKKGVMWACRGHKRVF